MAPSPLVEPVPDCLIFDTAQKLTRLEMEALYQAGFRGAIRYVGLNSQPSPEDIDPKELSDLMAVGFGVMLAQHVREGHWRPTSLMGETDGIIAGRHSQQAGYLQGATIWDDLESISGTMDDTVAYANAKLASVGQSGYPQGEYIGFDVPLSSHALYASLHTKIYWRSLSRVPDVEIRGYAMRQLEELTICGLDVDVNVHTADKLGGRAMWMRSV